MKAFLIKCKLVIKFIATFLLMYIALSVAYKFYLQFSDDSKFYPDFMAHLVTIPSETLLDAFEYNVQMVPHPYEPSIKLIVNNRYLARVI